MKKILVCEDEESIRSFEVINLQRAGYTVVQAASGEEALALYAADPTIPLALLDVMLPGIDGFAVCRRLREQSATMGIIMLTARSQEAEKVSGLQMGADDYITKPFSTAELLARVEALYRRLSTAQTESGASRQLQSGAFTLDMRYHRLLWQGRSIELTQVEYQIMECFFRHGGEVLERRTLLEAAWGDGGRGDDKIVDVNIRRLRMKIEDDPSTPRHLVTVWGRGYQWNG